MQIVTNAQTDKMHTYMQTHFHIDTHVHTDCTQIPNVPTNMHVHVHTRIHHYTHTGPCIHTKASTHTDMKRRMHIDSQRYTCTQPDTHMHTHTSLETENACTYTRVNTAATPMHTRRHTCTWTHSLTPLEGWGRGRKRLFLYFPSRLSNLCFRKSVLSRKQHQMRTPVPLKQGACPPFSSRRKLSLLGLQVAGTGRPPSPPRPPHSGCPFPMLRNLP